MNIDRWMTSLVVLIGLLCAQSLATADDKSLTPSPAPTVIRFAAGKWDKTKWTQLRMANQSQAKTFVQLDGAIGTTKETFHRKDYNAETDNSILLYNLGSPEAEIATTVTLGKGFGGYSCPGLCISPQVRDGVLVSSIAMFLADYTLAVWHQTTDADGKTVRYKHLLQLGRWSDPKKPHTLRCRISRKEGSVALKLDDSDVVVLQFVGNKTYGSITDPVNASIGLWGCHGHCEFRDFTIFPQPTLPFLVRTPEKTP